MSDGDFLVWGTTYENGMSVIEPPSGVDKSWELSYGISRQQGWPSDVTCHMSDDFPDDLELSDNVHGADVFVVSKQLKEVLGGASDKLEFLPTKIKNHKGRLASADYFIMNPLELVDCIDIEASGVVWNNIDKETISACGQLVIDPKRVPDSSRIFRLEKWPEIVIINDELANTLESANLKGLYFVDTSEFMGI